jgi:hypothetical protein
MAKSEDAESKGQELYEAVVEASNPTRKNFNRAKRMAEIQAQREMRELIDRGDESAYIAYVKAAKAGGITAEEVQKLVEIYRTERRRRHGV